MSVRYTVQSGYRAMLIGPKELKYYQSAKGFQPFAAWLSRLGDRKALGVIRSRLERFAEGNPGHWRYVGQGVFELKIYLGPGYRIYFGCEGPQLIILLIGGDKSTQTKDIYEAQTFWKDYQRRSHGTQC